MTLADEARLKIARRVKEYAIFNIDTEGRNASWNEGVREIFGYEENKWLGQPSANIFTEEDRANGAHLLEMEIAARDGSAGDNRWHVRMDGGLFWANSVLAAGYNAEGDLEGYVKIVQDRTDELRTEQELKENAAKFSALGDNMSQFAWLADANGKIHWFNRRWLEYTGMNPLEMTDNAWLDAIHPDVRDEIAGSFYGALSRGEAWEETYPLRRADGEYRTFLSRALPLRDEQGEIVRWIGTNTDVTEELATRRALEQYLIQVDSAAKAGNIVLWLWNVQTDRVRSSATLARLFNITEEEMQEGISLQEFLAAVHPEDRDSVQSQFEKTVESDEELSVTFRVVPASGRERWIYARGRAQYDQHGQPVRIAGAMVDITGQKEGQERLVELNRLLGRQYAMLDYVLSHTLRSPLRAINGFSNLLQEEYGAVLDESGREYLRRIATAATRLGQVMDAMLQLASLPRQKPNPKPTDLSKLTREVFAELVADSAAEPQLRVQEGLHAVVDADLMRLALGHVLQNALRYVDADGWIDVGRMPTDRGMAFYVRDTGKGFESQYARRIFEPFQRLDLSDETRLGIGLTILDQVVALHRGEAWAYSEPGNGATIFFTLGPGSRPWLLTELGHGQAEVPSGSGG